MVEGLCQNQVLPSDCEKGKCTWKNKTEVRRWRATLAIPKAGHCDLSKGPLDLSMGLAHGGTVSYSLQNTSALQSPDLPVCLAYLLLP